MRSRASWRRTSIAGLWSRPRPSGLDGEAGRGHLADRPALAGVVTPAGPPGHPTFSLIPPPLPPFIGPQPPVPPQALRRRA